MTTPSDLWNEAKLLDSDSAKTDTRRRTIIGRAYYAAYHRVLSAAKEQGFRYDPDVRGRNGRRLGSHQQLIEFLRVTGVRRAVLAGDALEVLRCRRTAADYELSSPVEIGKETDSVALAEEILFELLT
ncbi:MAG TPA: hypothetical protein VGE72_20960 [Azospirillum sp.]